MRRRRRGAWMQSALQIAREICEGFRRGFWMGKPEMHRGFLIAEGSFHRPRRCYPPGHEPRFLGLDALICTGKNADAPTSSRGETSAEVDGLC